MLLPQLQHRRRILDAFLHHVDVLGRRKLLRNKPKGCFTRRRNDATNGKTNLMSRAALRVLLQYQKKFTSWHSLYASRCVVAASRESRYSLKRLQSVGDPLKTILHEVFSEIDKQTETTAVQTQIGK
jgi:hypothetical protein